MSEKTPAPDAPGTPAGTPRPAAEGDPAQQTLDPEPTLQDQPVEQDPSEVLAAALLSIDGVASLHPGLFGEVATYLPGRRVAGVRLGDEGAEIHVRVAWGSDVHRVVDDVRRTAQQHVSGPVDVHVEDVAPPTSG